MEEFGDEPEIYHTIGRVVGRGILLGEEEREQFRMPMRTMAAYVDLNPVRAGMVSDPADYRWSSYGEAVGGGKKGNGKKKRPFKIADKGTPVTSIFG